MRRWLLLIMVLGCCPAWAGDALAPRAVIPFTGELDLKAGRIDLAADVRHMATPVGDVAASVIAHFAFAGNDPLRCEVSGELLTQYALLNYRPVRDVHVVFAVRDGRLSVDPFWFGALSGRGSIALAAPHTMDVTLELLSADLDGIWSFFEGAGIKPLPVSGIVTGALLLKGPLARPAASGRLQAYSGRIKEAAYESIDLRFNGTGPVLRVDEGKVVSVEGPAFRIAGALDLSDVSRLGTQIRQLKREFIVSQDEGGRSWALKLNAADGHSTHLKSFMSADTDDRNERAGVIGFEKHIGF